MRDTTAAADALMTTAWATLEKLRAEGKVAEPKAVSCFGKLQVRVILHILKKEKSGREVKVYKDLPEILKAYEEELKATAPSPSAAATADTSGQVKSLAEQTPSVLALMKHKHLKINEHYTNAANEKTQGKIFKFTKISNDCASFKHQPLFGIADVVEAKLEDLKDWKAFAGKPPVLVNSALALSCSASNSSVVLQEAVTSKAYVMLHSAFMANNPAQDSFHFSCNPMNVHSAKKFTSKNLKLFPLGSLTFIEASKASKHGCVVTFKDASVGADVFHLAVQQPRASLNLDQIGANEKAVLVPFWWVTNTSEEDMANLERDVFVVEEGAKSLTIPIYRSRVLVPPEAPLHFFKAKPEPKKRAKLA